MAFDAYPPPISPVTQALNRELSAGACGIGRLCMRHVAKAPVRDPRDQFPEVPSLARFGEPLWIEVGGYGIKAPSRKLCDMQLQMNVRLPSFKCPNSQPSCSGLAA